MRSKGDCLVERSAVVGGTDYDPGLVSQRDLESFAKRSMSDGKEDPIGHFERLVRHAERIRSHHTWPETLVEYLLSVESRSLEDQISELIPGTKLHLSRLARFKHRQPEEFRRTGWAKWLEDWKKEKGEVKRPLTKEETRERRRELHRMRVGVVRSPGRPKLTALNENGRWYAPLDQFGVEFLEKRHAMSWARHLRGVMLGKHERSSEYMDQLLDMDQHGGIRDRLRAKRGNGRTDSGKADP